jgi:xylose isomerase
MQERTMVGSPQFGAGIWLFGQFVDRYAADAYGPPVSTVEAIDRAGQVGMLVGLDVNFPFAGEVSVDLVRAALERNRLRAIAVTPHLYTRRFQNGAFTNPDPVIRQEAVDLCKRAIDVAHSLNADYVKLWPGQDGHDYPLQVDHSRLWDLELAGVREVALADPSQQFAIEYKLKEPRLHMVFSSAARTLIGIEDLGVSNVGIVLDFGHSLFAKETPADVLQLVHRRGKLVAVELNDNLLEFDDDLIVGAIHLAHTLEFLVGLRRIGWQRPWMLDQFPFREDPVQAARASIRASLAMNRLVDRLDPSALAQAQERHDTVAIQALLHDLLFGIEV